MRRRQIKLPGRLTKTDMAQISGLRNADPYLPTRAKTNTYQMSQSEPFQKYIGKLNWLQRLRKANKVRPTEFMDRLTGLNGDLKRHRRSLEPL